MAAEHAGDQTRRGPAGRGGFAASNGWSRSRTISLLKVVLPAVALALVTLVVLWSQISQSDLGFRIGFSGVQPEDARNLRMVNARYAGRNRARQPFLITADSALQEKEGADLIHLTEPKGDMTLRNGAWVALTAPAGQYRQDRQLLDLSGGTTLFHDSGLEFTTERAQIDLKNSTAQGDDPVTGHGPSAEIVSEGFRVLDRGDRVIFTGKAHLTLHKIGRRAERSPNG